MPITSTHYDYGVYVERWKRNRAACAGQDEVKQCATSSFLMIARLMRLQTQDSDICVTCCALFGSRVQAIPSKAC